MNGAFGLVVTLAVLSGCTANNDLSVTINRVSPIGVGESIGTVTIGKTSGGVQFSPDLRDLPPGEHGFHLHEYASCESGEKEGVKIPAMAAGGHYDPEHTGRHEGPEGRGHLGDLPVLVVDEKGFATTPVVAKRLKMSDLKGRSLMIHAGGDNYTDNPPMGGGGARIACGVIE
ncbi:MAG: superoxide dismutase [Cu-Zn] SodC [Endozoicomonas sp.]